MIKKTGYSTNIKLIFLTLLVALLSVLSFEVKAQEFTKAYGNSNRSVGHNGLFSQTHNAYFLLGTENEKIFTLTKIDLNGNVIWSKKYNGDYYTFTLHEINVPNKATTDIIISPTNYPTYEDLYLVRINGDNGNIVWNKKIKYPTENRFANTIVTSDNHIIVGMAIRSGGIFVTKTNINGEVLWAKVLDAPGMSYFQHSSNAIADNNGGAFLAFMNGMNGITGLVGITSDGNLSFAYQTNNNTNIRHIYKHPTNGYILSSYLDFNNRATKNELIYINNNYNIVWKKVLNPTTTHNGSCTVCSTPSSVVNNKGEIIHIRESAISGQVRFNFSKFDQNGNHIYSAYGNNNDLQFLSSGKGKNINIFSLGSTTRQNICLPNNTNMLLSVYTEDLEICDTRSFTPQVTNSTTTLSAMPLSTFTIRNAQYTLSNINTIATDNLLIARNLCSTQEEKVNLGPDISTCTSQPITLNAGTGYKSYTWSTGVTTPAIQVSTSGTYWVRTVDNCDRTSSDTIKVTIKSPTTRNQNISICQGGSYTIGNKTYTTAGTYSDTLITSTGCDSIVRTTLIVHPRYNNQQNITLCQGQSIRVGNKTYTTTGLYRDTLKSALGCDSIIVTNLTVNPTFNRTQTLSICQGDSVRIGNKIYKASGTYRDTLKTRLNCDSIIVTNLTVRQTYNQQLSFNICQGDSVRIGTQVFKTTGNFTVNLKSVFGCDSIIRANITVQQLLTTNIDTTICQGGSIRIGNNSYTQSGTYSNTLTSSAGCDSIVNVKLTVLESTTLTQSFRICKGDSIFVGTDVYTTTGEYTFRLKYPNGCDSVLIQTSLIVDEPLNVHLGNDTTLCDGEFITLRSNISAQNILWSTGSTESSIDIYEAGVYSVKATNTCGTFEDSIQIDFEDCDCKVFIPNAFSPNNDGKNDMLIIKEENITSSRIIIYNKWGEEVFVAENNQSNWNGIYKNKQLPPDVYGYYYTGTCLKGNLIELKGNITIVR